MVLVDKNLAGLDWNALLQKAEEGVKVLEEEGNFVIPNQTPQTGIEEMTGVSHAYYEKQLEEMGKLLEEAEALMNQKVTPTPPIEVSRSEAAGQVEETCEYCGRPFETAEERDEHEQGHRQPMDWNELDEEKEVKRLEEEIASLEGEG